MLILGLILFGMLVGAGAQLILGRSAKGIDWAVALVAGLVGSVRCWLRRAGSCTAGVTRPLTPESGVVFSGSCLVRSCFECMSEKCQYRTVAFEGWQLL